MQNLQDTQSSSQNEGIILHDPQPRFDIWRLWHLYLIISGHSKGLMILSKNLLILQDFFHIRPRDHNELQHLWEEKHFYKYFLQV